MIVGKETPRIVPSITIMDSPAAKTPRPAHLLCAVPTGEPLVSLPLCARPVCFYRHLLTVMNRRD